MTTDKIAALEDDINLLQKNIRDGTEVFIGEEAYRVIEAARAHLEQLKAGDDIILDAAIDRMGWPEINAFRAELSKGQDIYEDAGGFFISALKALFGIQQADNTVVTYQEAARAMVKKAQEQ